MRETFTDKKFSAGDLERIQLANAIIDEYDWASLTLRQLYYQFVARNYCLNNQREYNALGRLVAAAREAGLIDWKAIIDRTRYVRGDDGGSFSPRGHIAWAAQSFRYDLWELTQNYRPMVWVEKDAAIGAIERVCSKWRVPYIATKGCCSVSTLYEWGKRFADLISDNVQPVVFYLGDHDATGLKIAEEILPQGLNRYARYVIDFRHIALTKAQAIEFALPPNLVKDSDTRSAEYKSEHGEECWELDALSPEVIKDLIDAAILEVFDQKAWQEGLDAEASARAAMAGLADELKDLKRPEIEKLPFEAERMP